MGTKSSLVMGKSEALFSIRIARWEADASLLRIVRTVVFIQEQQVPAELEWDEFDRTSTHVLACDAQGEPIGTARFLPSGHIGRMAVMKEWRKQGVGSAILQKALEEMISLGMHNAVLNAQVAAVDFYRKFGFQVYGNEFMDAGIPHVKMSLQL